MPRLDPPHRPVNVSPPERMVDEPQALEGNAGQSCGRMSMTDTNATDARRWQAENQAAVAAWNEHVDRHGILLAEFRSF